MGTATADWESLGISNDFLFGKIMQDPGLCQKLLQRILPDLEIDHIEYPELQKEIHPDADAKGVRLDVYVKDNKETVYNIEMQASDTKELPKRSRYYQGMMDLQLLDKGDRHYKKLNRSYIIFICTFDLYGKGRHLYTFEHLCKEDHSISMGDEAVKIFLNSDSEMDDVSGELRAFLDYVDGKKTKDSYVEELEEAVEKARKNREWRHEYMTLEMREREVREEGREEGKIEARTEDIGISVRMLKSFHIQNQNIVEQLVKEYHLTKEEAEEYVNRG